MDRYYLCATMERLFDVLEFGAAGDGAAQDGPAIQKAIDACHARGGGRVLLPSGHAFLSGALELKSRVDFHVQGGARLLASPRREDYAPRTDLGEGPGGSVGEMRTLIRALGAEGITLSGDGTIDGQARLHMVEELPHIFRGSEWRPRLVALEDCRRVRVRDLTLKDSPNWGLHLSGCDDVVVHGATILNDLKVPNCDGIDPDHCRNVRISDCHIEAGDDCIVLKSTRPFAKYGPCENITITGCTLVSTSCAVKIGSETVGDIRNVVVQGCTIRSSNRGLGILLRDEGTVENVLFSGITVETRLFHPDWWGKAEPIYVTCYPRAAGGKAGKLRNVRFRDILCRSENGVFVRGCPESRPEGLRFEGVRVEIDAWSGHAGGWQDHRPCPGQGLVERPTAGFYLEEARDVELGGCEVAWAGERRPYYGHALEAHRVEDLRTHRFRGRAAHPHLADTVMD